VTPRSPVSQSSSLGLGLGDRVTDISYAPLSSFYYYRCYAILYLFDCVHKLLGTSRRADGPMLWSALGSPDVGQLSDL